MIIKFEKHTHTYKCPCGWTITQTYTRESELKMIRRLHDKVCSEAKKYGKTVVFNLPHQTTITKIG